MSTAYYAIPKKVVIEAGLKRLFQKTPKSLIEEAMEILNNADGNVYNSIPDNEDVIEIGTVVGLKTGLKFIKNEQLSEEALEKILKNPDYCIIEEHSKYYETNEFIERVIKKYR